MRAPCEQQAGRTANGSRDRERVELTRFLVRGCDLPCQNREVGG